MSKPVAQGQEQQFADTEDKDDIEHCVERALIVFDSSCEALQKGDVILPFSLDFIKCGVKNRTTKQTKDGLVGGERA